METWKTNEFLQVIMQFQNAAVVKLARHTGLKIPHEDTLWVQIPPAVPISNTDFNVLKQHRTGYASAKAADWTLERLGSIPIWLLVGEKLVSIMSYEGPNPSQHINLERFIVP